ncbi:MAG: uroporphyrinogen decarboxylase family protein [Phycisphaerae bacterium]
MPLTKRENFLKNANFRGHEWIPQWAFISPPYWRVAREELEDICLRHPVLFPDFRKGQIDFDQVLDETQRERTDEWGCRWRYELDGLEGIVIEHPLEDWAALSRWKPPQPPVFDDSKRQALEGCRARGEITRYDAPHGFFLMRLYYLRGMENFLEDVGMNDPRLDQLATMVADHWEQAFAPYLAAGLDVLNVADDLGTQTASLLGPTHFRRLLMPHYKRLFHPAREKGTLVSMHHDGYIMDIIDDLLECGVSTVNPQDLVNGIDNIARCVKGRACIKIDIDRQQVLPFGSPAEVRDLVREEVLKLGSPAGGLEMVVGIYPPTPLANIEALFSALEEYRTYWVGRAE